MKTLPAIDLLRAAAAFEVMLAHVRGGSFVAYKDLPESDHGVAVWLLFAVTHF